MLRKQSVSVLVKMHVHYVQRQVNVNGHSLKWKDKVKYLGNILTKDMCDDADIYMR